jgi:hypothetical protein
VEQEPEVGEEMCAGEQDREAIRGAIRDGEKKPRTRGPGPNSCRKYTRRELARALPEIVKTFVKKAEAGSVAHARVLTSLSGLDGEPVPPPKQRRTKGFVGLLLDKLERDFPDQPDEEDDEQANRLRNCD